MKVQHSQLVRDIAQLSGHHVPTVEDVLQKLALVVWRNMADLNPIVIRDIGTLKPTRQKGRKVMNVKTGETMISDPFTKIVLMPSLSLRKYASQNHDPKV